MKLNDLGRQTLPRLTSMQANRRQMIYREREDRREVERDSDLHTTCSCTHRNLLVALRVPRKFLRPRASFLRPRTPTERMPPSWSDCNQANLDIKRSDV